MKKIGTIIFLMFLFSVAGFLVAYKVLDMISMDVAKFIKFILITGTFSIAGFFVALKAALSCDGEWP